MTARAAMDPCARGWESRTVPLSVAPPPRTGDAAQGPWYADPPSIAATDHAAVTPDGPATESAHPKPAATARTVAAGDLFASATAYSRWDDGERPRTAIAPAPSLAARLVGPDPSSDRATAAGLALATIALLLAAIPVALALLVRLVLLAAPGLTLDGPALAALALGFAFANVAVLVALT